MYEEGTGVVRQTEDKRDFTFSAVAPFDFVLGFDIELVLGFRTTCKTQDEFFGPRGRDGWGIERYKEILAIVKEKSIIPYKIPPKDQGASYSCTGQGLAQYIAVLNFIETGIWVEISARDIYAYVSLGYAQGAMLRDALKLAKDRGIATEELVPSYENIKTDFGIQRSAMNETQYLVKPEETDAIKAIRTVMEAKDYRLCDAPIGSRMDQVAWAILQGFGCYFGVMGENNGTWTSLWPAPPKSDGWGHALYAGKVGIRDGKKYIGPINSWGNSVGLGGWQYISEDYFLTAIGSNEAVFNPWTLIDKPNTTPMPNNANVKILKDQNSAAVGFFIPATSESALQSLYATLFGVDTLPRKTDGTVDWDTLIQGNFTLK